MQLMSSIPHKDAGCSPDIRNNKYARLIVPTVFVLLMIYGSWAYIHKLCVKQLYIRSGQRATGIALIVTHGCLLVLEIVIWLQIVLIGPGIQPRVPAFELVKALPYDSVDSESPIPGSNILNKTIPPPKVYECDIHGYPNWCPHCGSVKTFRTHHSRTLGACIPRFDHYCSWLGTVIGQDNYKLFMQFVGIAVAMLGMMWITTIICYLKYFSKRGHDGNLVALVILAGLGFFFVAGLWVSHIYNGATHNLTSLDVMDMKNKDRREKILFICVWHESTETRYVVQITREDYGKFWSKGTWLANLQDEFGSNIGMWFVPWHIRQKQGDIEQGSKSISDYIGKYGVTVSDESLKILNEKIDAGDFICVLDAHGDRGRRDGQSDLKEY